MSISQTAPPMQLSVEALAHAFAGAAGKGVIRLYPEDFRVDEELGFEPEGEGTHVWLRIRKSGSNTEWVARQLAKHAGVKPLDVGYAGLKDRNAVTSQWFSINLAGRDEPDWRAIETPDLTVIDIRRHGRKLRRGTLRGNRFEIVVRDLTDAAGVQSLLPRVAASGVPNYFGEQRFGSNGDNVERAVALFNGQLRERDRHKRGLYLSAARSYLFNQILSQRVEQGSWDQALDGDVMMLDGSHSIFVADSVDDEIRRRVAEQDLHPTAPLWGRGPLASHGAVRHLEQSMAERYPDLTSGLERAGMSQERRPLRLAVKGLEWSFTGERTVTLRFSLPAGAYGTSVLRELVDWS